jgi:hypothetical protein
VAVFGRVRERFSQVSGLLNVVCAPIPTLRSVHNLGVDSAASLHSLQTRQKMCTWSAAFNLVLL